MIEPLDEQGDRALIQTVEPVNHYPDFVRFGSWKVPGKPGAVHSVHAGALGAALWAEWENGTPGIVIA